MEEEIRRLRAQLGEVKHEQEEEQRSADEKKLNLQLHQPSTRIWLSF